MTTETTRERWAFCKERVDAPSLDSNETDGFKRRFVVKTYEGHIVEEFDNGEGVVRLQATGETLEFVTYWKGTIDAGSLIYLKQDPNDGVYKVHGAECPGD